MPTIRITLTPASLADLDAICKRSGYSRSEQIAGMIEAAKAEEVEILDKLCKCGAPAGEPRACPFKSELHGNDEPCDCCDSCRHECAMDI